MSPKKRGSSRRRSRPVAPKKTNLNVKTILILAIIAIIIIISAVFLFIGNNSDGNNNGVIDGNPIAVINTDKGTIRVELFQDKVPKTCTNFIDYVKDGFYDGLVFHRVIDNFMIQGGGFYPNGTKKGTNDPIDLEINEEVRHVDGAIAMARTNDPNSATSQFYICDGVQDFLDDNYAAFGKVIEGIDVVRAIAEADKEAKYPGHTDWPIDDVIINSITIENQ